MCKQTEAASLATILYVVHSDVNAVKQFFGNIAAETTWKTLVVPILRGQRYGQASKDRSRTFWRHTRGKAQVRHVASTHEVHQQRISSKWCFINLNDVGFLWGPP
jgi:hypothetical protein